MNRSVFSIATILVVLLGFFLWKQTTSVSDSSSKKIQPLMIDKSSLVGSWIGFGGRTNQIEVKIQITNDYRIPLIGTGNVLEEQMNDNYRFGVLSPTQGTISISGLSDECRSVSGVVSGGTAEGNSVGWSGYAGRIGEDNGGSWEDTAHFTIAGTLDPNYIKGQVQIQANSDDCKFNGIFDVTLYLVKAPTPRKAAQLESKSDTSPNADSAAKEYDQKPPSRTPKSDVCPDADIVGIKDHSFTADEEISWRSNDGAVKKDDHVRFVRDSEGNVSTSEADKNGDLFYTLSSASKNWTKQWHQGDKTGLTYPFQSEKNDDAKLISDQELGTKVIDGTTVDGAIVTCSLEGTHQTILESWSSRKFFTYIDLNIKDEYHNEHRHFSRVSDVVQDDDLVLPPKGMKFTQVPVE